MDSSHQATHGRQLVPDTEHQITGKPYRVLPLMDETLFCRVSFKRIRSEVFLHHTDYINSPPKKKGNPVITRYPPPPGYRGPAQPQGPFGANQFPGRYQAPHSGYPQGVHMSPSYYPQGHNATPVSRGYQGQGYGVQQPSSHHPQTYSPAHTRQWPQHLSYPPYKRYSQPLNPSAKQGYTPYQDGYQGHPPQHVSQQTYGQAGQRPSQNGQPQIPSQDHHVSRNSVPTSSIDANATPTLVTVQTASSRAASVPNQSNDGTSHNSTRERPHIFLAWDDWDFEFDGAIWPKSNEAVDPSLSLGIIIWHPAKQVTRALPSTFAEAEAQALEPTPEALGNGESVSMYFTAENSHEAFLDVRQTDDWCTIRDDPVFVVFTDEEMQNNAISIEECITQRDRPDELSESKNQNEDHEMRDASWDIMENLDQALTNKNRDSESQRITQQDVATQEDVLAKLGVTGAPKPPSHHMHVPQLPASLPGKPSTVPHTKAHESQPAPPRANSYSGSQNPACTLKHPRPYGSLSSSSTSRTPPPPPPAEQPGYDSWYVPQHSDYCHYGRAGSPMLSEASNRTMVGSDFESEKPCDSNQHDTSVVPTLQRSDSSFNRKRSYEDADKDGEQLRQHDDHSKRKRRSQVDAAYRYVAHVSCDSIIRMLTCG